MFQATMDAPLYPRVGDMPPSDMEQQSGRVSKINGVVCTKA